MSVVKEISDYTEAEFLSFVLGIYTANSEIYPTERAHTKAILEFKRLSGHPLGTDLMYYPTKHGLKDSPEEVVRIVKEWRAAQGLPGFKVEQ